MRVDGFVLAGGRSRRMGRDKARVRVDGVPMAVRVARVLGTVCDRVALVRHEPDDWGELEVVGDPPEATDRHPLWGVVAALRAARTPMVVIASCDVPDLTEQAVRALLLQVPSVAFDGTRVHPLVAVVPASWADRAAAHAAGGQSAHDFVAGCRRVTLPAEVLRNVNLPGDLAGPR